MNARLTQEQKDGIFSRLIAPNALRGTSPVRRRRPKAIIVAGAPGSGKGGLTALARRDLAATLGGHVEIDVDELRWYHPRYEPLQRANDRTAATQTHADVTEWGDALRRRCIAQKRNLVIDGTLKDPAKTLRMCAELREAGYETEVRVIGLPKQLSVQGIYRRYEGARARGRPGRWVPENVHDAAHLGVPESVQALHERGAVDKITVYHRDASTPTDARGRLAVRAVSSTTYGPGAEPSPPPPHIALHQVRTRPLTEAERICYRLECKRICEAIRRRDEGLDEAENLRAFELGRMHGADVSHPRLNATTARPEPTSRDDVVAFTPPSRPKPERHSRSVSASREIA